MSLSAINEETKEFHYYPENMGSETAVTSPSSAPAGIGLRAGLKFFKLDDELIVFSEAAQSLVALNATAAQIVRRLSGNIDEKDLADLLAREANVPAAEAAAWVEATYDALASKGLLDDGTVLSPPAYDSSKLDAALSRRRAWAPPLMPFEPVAVGHYRLLETHLIIRYAHRAQKRMVDAVIGHLAAAESAQPNLVIDITAKPWGDRELSSFVYCDGKVEAIAKQLCNLGPLVKSAFWATAVNAFDFILDVHAGVVGREGRCILLPAAPGCGKSSMTAALTHAGLGYYSDEVALVERGTLRVHPVPLATCVKDTGWSLMSRYYPEIDRLPKHRRDDGKIVRYLPPDTTSIQTKPAKVSHIFFPQYAPDERTRIEPLPRSAALARLMDQCQALRHRLDSQNVKGLIDWIGGIDSFALTFSSLDQAVDMVKDASNFP